MTDEAQTRDNATASWESIEEKSKRANGNPFYPLADLPQGMPTRMRIKAIRMDPATFQGKFSVFEMDIETAGRDWTLCVSGSRLAGAIAKLRPEVDDVLDVTAIGAPGMDRRWTAAKVAIPKNGLVPTVLIPHSLHS